MNKGFLIFFFTLISIAVTAQDPQRPSGQFLVDSMKIGEPVPYSLSFAYPAELDAIFPDSLADFTPFEIDHKVYFPTRTANGISLDSAVYYLSCFEIDSFQVYAMPVLLAANNDSVSVLPAADTIFLKQLVTEIPDSVAVEAMPLRENTNPVSMNLAVNYPYIMIGLGLFVLIVIIVIVAFGKRIVTFYRLHVLNRKHNKFLLAFDELADQTALSVQDKSEKLIILWKKYLQQLESYPYTTLTTREVIERIPKDALTNVLQQMDASMYSPKHPQVNRASLETLKEFAVERYERKLVKVKNRE